MSFFPPTTEKCGAQHMLSGRILGLQSSDSTDKVHCSLGLLSINLLQSPLPVPHHHCSHGGDVSSVLVRDTPPPLPPPSLSSGPT